jgi:hypothetical protein
MFFIVSNWKNLSDTFKVSDKSDYQSITIKKYYQLISSSYLLEITKGNLE